MKITINRNTMQKYLKYLFFLNIFLLSAAIVARLVSQSWSIFSIVLLIAGIISSIIWTFYITSKQKFWQLRSTEAGTNALISSISVIAILVLINFLGVNYLTEIDLTENQLLTLSTQTQEVVENLKQPIKIFLFVPQKDQANQQLLENYSSYNSLFEYQFVDPDSNIELARKFNVKSLGEVYIEYENKRELVKKIDRLESIDEATLTNAILKIQRDSKLYIYFLQGHGEATLDANEGGLFQAITSLQEKGYIVGTLNLAETSTIPENTNAITIINPQRKLLPGEITILQNYLDNGGNLLVMLDAEINSNLDTLLEKWGIKLDNRLILDASGAGALLGLGPAATLITNYGTHPITEDFSEGISIYPFARPININDVENIEKTPLLITNRDTWGESNLEGEAAEFNPNEDLQGPLNMAFALIRNDESSQNSDSNPNSEANNTEENPSKTAKSKLVIIGNGTFATNGWFEQQLNGDMFLNSVSWLAGEDDANISIRPKEPKNRRINLLNWQAGIITWLALVVMPLLAFTTALGIWWQRR